MAKRTIRKYTDEFKKSSAQLAVESGKPISDTAKNLGVSSSTLNGWVKNYATDIQTNNCLPSDRTQTGTQTEEIKKLKKELDRVKQERDILKKAAAYFAGEMR